jgi:hypothetical protein
MASVSALAPRRVQNVPDCLSRDPMMVLHNSFDRARTDEEMLFPKRWSSASGGRCAKSIPLRCGSALRPCDPRWRTCRARH